MKHLPLEYCIKCDQPTGRAGRAEDSLYCDNPDCDKGPYCEDCYTTDEEGGYCPLHTPPEPEGA